MIPRYTPITLFRNANPANATYTGESAGESERRQGGLMASLTISVLTGGAPSITGKVQHSPSPYTVADASAIWLDLLTFTAQTVVGAQTQTIATPYFPRLRGQITVAGTTATITSEIVAI